MLDRTSSLRSAFPLPMGGDRSSGLSSFRPQSGGTGGVQGEQQDKGLLSSSLVHFIQHQDADLIIKGHLKFFKMMHEKPNTFTS